MKHYKNIKVIAIIAFSLSIFGFIIDLNELDPNRLNNIIDITMMTLIIFSIGMLIYGLIVFFLKIIRAIRL